MKHRSRPWRARTARASRSRDDPGLRIVVPRNITIIALPPKCPELNPVENVWQFLRDNWLSNRVFESYDDLVDHCCAAWNKLVDQPWRIMSIGLRQWARTGSDQWDLV
jgi:transposase